MTKRKAITQDYLRSILDYDPETGLWRWREQKGRRAKGWFAGACDGQGYPTIGIRCDGQDTVYKAHRLAFLYMTGEWPEAYIDHKNQIKTDNRWSNLRSASRTQNAINRVKWKSRSSFKGAYYRPWNPDNPDATERPWRAGIRVNRKMIWLGTYASEAEAADAYRKAAIEHHGEFACFD